MSDAGFGKFVPGFDFLQGLVKNAGAALPGIGQWVAPTLDPAELDKRIGELRTVQFWLEQNAKMLGATIQALEVQRMTLSTLKTMNVQMDDLRESMQIRMPAARADTPPSADKADVAQPAEKTAEPRAKPAPTAATADDAKAAAPPVDPMQWWSALTQQFTQLAASAMKDGAAETARAMGSAFTGTAADASAPGNAAASPAASKSARRPATPSRTGAKAAATGAGAKTAAPRARKRPPAAR